MKHYNDVNIKMGTDSHPLFSQGNTLPLVSRPFGAASFALQTQGASAGWFYNPRHKQTEGVRLTRLASPWLSDYANLVLLPQSGEAVFDAGRRSTSFAQEEMSPAYLSLYLRRYRVQMELVPGVRSAMLRLRWDGEDGARLTLLPFAHETSYRISEDGLTLTGFTKAGHHYTHPDFALYFAFRFDHPVDGARTVTSEGEMSSGAARGVGLGMSVGFDAGVRSVQVRMGISYISEEQALWNLEAETGGRSFADFQQEGRDAWEDYLSRIEIETDDEAVRRTFYSCLYRTALFPRVFHEYDAQGKAVYFDNASGSVHEGVFYTDNGFWDTSKTVYALYALICPDRYAEFVQGFLNCYDDTGWLPKWISPSELGMMPGTLIDSVLAEAAVKGLLTQEQAEKALEGMLHHSRVQAEEERFGRRCVEEYRRKGYVPRDLARESVNQTLDYCFGDFCIAQIAQVLGKTQIEEEYRARSQGYRCLFDERTGFIRGRNADGSFPADFDPFAWGGDYCEGSAWQNAFSVYHDIGGLARLYGGAVQLEKKIDELFASEPRFDVGAYGVEIHEMTEMAVQSFGQCALSNQPSFHLPYIYALLGRREKTVYWVKRAVRELFTPDAFCGDEDNGSMAALYIFNMLGFYPFCPASGEYVLSAPSVKKACLRLPSGELTVLGGPESNGNSVTLRGKELGERVAYADLMQGGTLAFA